MSMMWPPQSVKIVSTPSFLSALATKWPPETTLASRVFCFSVSSAVVVPRTSAALLDMVASERGTVGERGAVPRSPVKAARPRGRAYVQDDAARRIPPAGSASTTLPRAIGAVQFQAAAFTACDGAGALSAYLTRIGFST